MKIPFYYLSNCTRMYLFLDWLIPGVRTSYHTADLPPLISYNTVVLQFFSPYWWFFSSSVFQGLRSTIKQLPIWYTYQGFYVHRKLASKQNRKWDPGWPPEVSSGLAPGGSSGKGSQDVMTRAVMFVPTQSSC